MNYKKIGIAAAILAVIICLVIYYLRNKTPVYVAQGSDTDIAGGYTWTTSGGLEAAQAACNADSKCTGFYYNPTNRNAWGKTGTTIVHTATPMVGGGIYLKK